MRQKKLKPWLLLSPSLTAIFLMLVVPVCFVVVYSFWLRSPIGQDIPAFQFGNYSKFIIRTLSWINILGESGLINHMLMSVGLIDSPFDMLYNEGAVLMGLLQYLLPFMILNIYVSLDGIDRSLTEAAKGLGCTEWQAFKEIILPLSLPGVSAGCLLVFVLTCGTYLPPMILGGPGNEMIANLVFKRIITTLDWPFGCAISTILLALVGLLVFAYNKYLGINQVFKSLGG